MSSASKPFPAIEGLRSIMNFWIVALHQHMIQKFFLAVYGKQDQLEYLSTTSWSGIAVGNGYQVDVFFTLSAFLFTWSLLSSKSNSPHNAVDPNAVDPWYVALGLFLVKRVFRLWPVLIAVLSIAYMVRDFGANNLSDMAIQLLIPNYYDDIPQAVVPAWSNRVDMECCVVLFFVISALRYMGCLNTITAVLVTLLSLIPKALRFLSDPDAFSYMRLGADVMTTAIMMPIVRQDYYRDVLYKGIHKFESIDTDPRMTPMFWNEYIVQHQRWSPAFVGFAMAVALYGVRHAAKKTEDCTTTSVLSMMWTIVCRIASFVTLLLAIVFAALPVLMSLSPPTAEIRATVLTNPPIEADFFVSVLGRTLNSAGWAYLLYRCLLPSKHPLRLNYLARFLELPMFQFVGRHSYCIYMLHYIVLHFVNFYLLPPAKLAEIVGGAGNDKLFAQFVVLFLTVYGITFAMSLIIVRFVEQPLSAVLQTQVKKLEAVVCKAKSKIA